MQNCDEASPCTISVGRGIIAKILITLSCNAYFDQILQTYTFYFCLDTDMQNNDKTWLSARPAGHSQLMKMLITLEPHGYEDLFLLTYTLNIFWPQVCKTRANSTASPAIRSRTALTDTDCSSIYSMCFKSKRYCTTHSVH